MFDELAIRYSNVYDTGRKNASNNDKSGIPTLL